METRIGTKREASAAKQHKMVVRQDKMAADLRASIKAGVCEMTVVHTAPEGGDRMATVVRVYRFP